MRIANSAYKEAYDLLSEANNLVPNNPIVIASLCIFKIIFKKINKFFTKNKKQIDNKQYGILPVLFGKSEGCNFTH